MMRLARLFAPLGVGALLATGGGAFLAVNSQPVSGEGVSMGVVDGYSISAISYNVDPPPPPGPNTLTVSSVTFTATPTAAGENPAAQGFVRLDPPPPPPGPRAPWTGCSLSGSSGSSRTFTCTFTPPVAVNGQPGGSPVGVLTNLEIEVNQ